MGGHKMDLCPDPAVCENRIVMENANVTYTLRKTESIPATKTELENDYQQDGDSAQPSDMDGNKQLATQHAHETPFL